MPNAPQNILVVDDEQILLDEIGSYLDRLGYRYLQVSNGLHAMDALRALDFDLVISDVRMPVVDGPHLVRHIEAHYPELPVILMTGFEGHDESMVLPEKLRLVEFLRKPFRLKELKACIERLLEDRSARSLAG